MAENAEKFQFDKVAKISFRWSGKNFNKKGVKLYKFITITVTLDVFLKETVKIINTITVITKV